MAPRYIIIIVVACMVSPVAGCKGSGGAGDAGDEDVSTDTGGDGDVEADVPADATEEEPQTCTLNSDCDDGLYCNGQESCTVEGTCVAGSEMDCDDSDPCTMDLCVEDSADCSNSPLDADGDGFVAQLGPGGESCGGADCDDGAASVYPDAGDDECDLVDSDCDGLTSEHIDDDGDGWIDDACDTVMTDHGDYEGPGDCDDTDDTIHPEAAEGCDGTVDHDCDGDSTEIETDADGDGHAPLSCSGNDCDDTDDTIHPGAEESCDLVDDDCDGSILDAPGIDDDMDGVPETGCGGQDCDDDADTVHGADSGYPASGPPHVDDPVGAATDICDTVDQDCDGSILDAVGADDDSDTYLDQTCGGPDCNDASEYIHPGAAEDSCDSIDNDCDGDNLDGIADQDDDDVLNGVCAGGTDCDDEDASIHPGATLLCDDVDNDCDGSWRDEAGSDDDSDTVLDAACGGTDCDDEDAGVHPGAAENQCDTVDDDCDGDALDGMADDDDDDYMDTSCPGGDDCDDTQPSVHPGGTEICDTLDQDCDGSVLDATGADDDSDTVLDELCGGADCDDSDAAIHPGAVEDQCDLVDDDCDGDVLDGTADDDDDDYMDESCTGGTDCNDEQASVHPGATEICDTVDQDCDGLLTDAPGGDKDTDSYLDELCGGDDCDDLNSTVFPGAAEYCDLVDDDCDGLLTDAPGGDDDSDTVLDEDCGGTDCDDDDGLAFPGATETCRDGVDQDCDTLIDGPIEVVTDVRVTNDTADSFRQDAAWSGSQYGIAWQDYRDGNYEVYFAIVDASGAKQGTDVRVTNNSGASWRVSIAWDGSQYGIAWDDNRNGAEEIYFARVSAGGAKLSTDIRVTNDGAQSIEASVAWTGSEFGIVWTEQRDADLEIYFARVTGAGVKQGADVRITSSAGESRLPSFTWAGSRFGAAWSDRRDGGFPEIYFGTFSPTGARTSPDLRITNEEADSWMPSVAWADGEYGIAWQDRRDGNFEIYFARCSDVPTKLGSDVRITDAIQDSEMPDIAWTGSQYGICWDDLRISNEEIYFAIVSPAGVKASTDLRVTSATQYSVMPAIEWSGSEFGIAWEDNRDGNFETYFTLIGLCD